MWLEAVDAEKRGTGSNIEGPGFWETVSELAGMSPFGGAFLTKFGESGISLAWPKSVAILPGSPRRSVCASVAQLVELRFCKPVVVGSSPSASFRILVEDCWLPESDCLHSAAE